MFVTWKEALMRLVFYKNDCLGPYMPLKLTSTKISFPWLKLWNSQQKMWCYIKIVRSARYITWGSSPRCVHLFSHSVHNTELFTVDCSSTFLIVSSLYRQKIWCLMALKNLPTKLSVIYRDLHRSLLGAKALLSYRMPSTALWGVAISCWLHIVRRCHLKGDSMQSKSFLFTIVVFPVKPALFDCRLVGLKDSFAKRWSEATDFFCIYVDLKGTSKCSAC